MSESNSVPPRFQAALDRLDGDLALLRQMASITTEDLPSTVQQIEQAIETQNAEQAAKSLHRLKGMLSTFETDGVMLGVQDLLDTARDGTAETLTTGFAKLRAEIDSLIQAIADLSED